MSPTGMIELSNSTVRDQWRCADDIIRGLQVSMDLLNVNMMSVVERHHGP